MLETHTDDTAASANSNQSPIVLDCQVQGIDALTKLLTAIGAIWLTHVDDWRLNELSFNVKFREDGSASVMIEAE